MKKVFLKSVVMGIILAATMNVTAVAQKGEKAVGANLLYGSMTGYSNLGLGAKFFYNVTDPIRLAGEFDYFLKKNYTSIWDVSVYGHYLFPAAEKMKVFPSVGLGVVGTSVSVPTIAIPGMGEVGGGSLSSSNLAISLGGGLDYDLTSNLLFNAELRYKIITGNGSGSWLNIAVGVAYKF